MEVHDVERCRVSKGRSEPAYPTASPRHRSIIRALGTSYSSGAPKTRFILLHQHGTAEHIREQKYSAITFCITSWTQLNWLFKYYTPCFFVFFVNNANVNITQRESNAYFQPMISEKQQGNLPSLSVLTTAFLLSCSCRIELWYLCFAVVNKLRHLCVFPLSSRLLDVILGAGTNCWSPL